MTKKIFIFSISCLFLAIPFFAFAQMGVESQLLDPEAGNDIWEQSEALRESAGFADTSNSESAAGHFVAVVINAFLGMLGIIFVVLIILAGYHWMTAQGEQEKVNKAKESLKQAIIGLVLIIAAYAITFFVFANLNKAIDTAGM